MGRNSFSPLAQAIIVCAFTYVIQQSAQAQEVAPGGPGASADWLPANKTGFGTSYTTSSNVWFTIQAGRLSEVYYPDLGTPSVRNLDFVVTDGSSFAVRAQDASTSETRLADPDRGYSEYGDGPKSLTYQIVNIDKANRWRLVTTYVTDPSRASLLIDVQFTSLSGLPYQVFTLYQPQLNNPSVAAPLNESGSSQNSVLLSIDAQQKMATALIASTPGFIETSNGYLGNSDGWTDLSQHYRLTADYSSAPSGTVVQTGRTALTGLPRHQHLTLALGFAANETAALDAAKASLTEGFARVSHKYAKGWSQYLASLRNHPRSLVTPHQRKLYLVSAMVLAASEDKLNRGAFVASPTMPWAWGTGLANPSGGYHLVWSRDLYEIATALIADGDLAGARRALDFLLNHQQKADGSFPQNSLVDGTPYARGLQLDEVGDPIILAYQLGLKDAATWSHVRRAANFLVNFVSSDGHRAPYTPGERWETQSGYSPASIASEVAGLVCAADIARANGDTASAALYLATADSWQAQVENWTVTHTGPYSSSPHFLRLTKDGNPNAGTTYGLGRGGPSAIDQRSMVDPSFLELVRLGVKPASDPAVTSSLHVIDAQLATNTPRGQFWHRYNNDGYGETSTGDMWDMTAPDTFITHGRVWPIFAGERGEYDLTAHKICAAKAELIAMGRTANQGLLLPEQVWDQQPPAGQPGFTPGTGTFSATPLAWTHAQFIRLAFDIVARRPAEQPDVVADRYGSH
jgi:glucoamylase